MTPAHQTEWRPVAEPYPLSLLYEVSSDGLVRSTKKRNRFSPKVLSPGRAGAGYKFICLYHNGRKYPRYIHRLVAMAFIGEPPTPKHQVAHADGNKENNRADNLSWKTAVDNNLDKHQHGTMPVGENHSSTKLTSDQVSFIRTCGLSLSEMSAVVGGSISTLSRIRSGKSRKYD